MELPVIAGTTVTAGTPGRGHIMHDVNWLPIPEVAERLEISKRSAWRLAQEGFFTTRKYPGMKNVFVSEADVEEFKRQGVRPKRTVGNA
jgi:predicted DNA-binding transcriptional regulator AlpA